VSRDLQLYLVTSDNVLGRYILSEQKSGTGMVAKGMATSHLARKRIVWPPIPAFKAKFQLERVGIARSTWLNTRQVVLVRMYFGWLELRTKVQVEFQIWSNVKWDSTAHILCSRMLLCHWWPMHSWR